MIVHAEHIDAGDYTLCGLGIDAFEDGRLSDEPVMTAKQSQTVTCDRCQNVIRYCQKSFTPKFRYREVA